MQTTETLLEARWIVPVEPAGIVFEHHTLVVDGGRIRSLLPIAEARAAYPDAERVALDRHALFPGLVNAHTHAAMSLLRGYADDLALGPWLREHIWPAERRWVGPEFVRDGAELAVAEMIRGGITCFGDQYFFPEQVAAVCHDAHMRVRLGIVVIDFPTAYASGPDEYLANGLALHDQWKTDPLISCMFAPHAPYTVAPELLAHVGALADELDLPITIHLHETADEVAQSVAKHGVRPIAQLEKLGLLTPALMAVHMTHLQADEIALLAQCGTHVIHCPQSNMKLANGSCPVTALQAAGVNVGLGTDGAASNNDLDLIDEMRTAALLAKASAGDASALTAHQTLRMATLNSAKALGLADEIGSLVPGKAADLFAIDLDDIGTVPVYDPVSALVYASHRSQVTDVWVAGRAVMRRRELLTLDAPTIRDKARQWGDRIR